MFRPLKGGYKNKDFDLLIISADITAAKIGIAILVINLLLILYVSYPILMRT